MAARVFAVIPSPEAAGAIVALTKMLRGDHSVKYLALEERGSERTETAIRAAIGEAGGLDIEIVTSLTPVTEVLRVCKLEKPDLLITSVFSIETIDGGKQSSQELIRSVQCRAITALNDRASWETTNRIVMVATSGAHDLTALKLATHLGESLGVDITLAILEQDTGAKAHVAGEKALKTLVHDAAMDDHDFEFRVIVDSDPERGIQRAVQGHDVIVAGEDTFLDLWRSSTNDESTRAVVVKRQPPLQLRSLPDWIPRINPRDHADLLQDLRHGSKWKTDFVAMLGLASAIATLGLMQNSPAVVIGSMLLAPLMTPMIGLGLALAQANASMAKMCGKSILLGFFLTLGVSFLLGIVTPSRETLSPEVISRGTPNVLDLLIALFAAIAATVAMARPNISGAIAGVAIATALVPPICSIGLSLSISDFGNAAGAFVLFATNLIAIIIASSFTFTALGISTERSLVRYQRYSLWGRFGLILLLIAFAGPLSIALLNQLEKGRDQIGIYPVTRAVSRALRKHVSADKGIDIVLMGRSSVVEGVMVYIAAEHEVPKSYAAEIRAIVQNEMHDPDMPVYVICIDGQWLDLPDDDAFSDL